MTDIFVGNKVFVLVTGNTLNVDKKFMEHLKQQKPDLQEVKNVAECDYVLVFCPIVSQALTDIEAALKKFQDIAGSKPALLVVLHHTFDKDYVVPDSSRAVKRKNLLTVDCLFHEDQGLLQCTKNDESLGKILSIIKPEASWWSYFWFSSPTLQTNNMEIGPSKTESDMTSEIQNATHIIRNSDLQNEQKASDHQPAFIQMLKRPRLTYVTIMSGKTLGHHVDIEKKLQELIPGLQMVMKLEESDFILIFCPVVTQAGTDIVEALKMLNTQAGDKPAVLVVLHHTRDPELIVPDSSRSVNRQNTITVDCLFYEDQGLLTCHKNNEALSKVVNWLHPKSDENPEKNNKLDNFEMQGGTLSKSPYHQPSGNQMLKRPRLTYFTLMTGNTLGHHVDIERKLQELIPGLQNVMKLEESDLVLVFCPVVSRAGTDTEAAVEMLNTQAGDKPAVLVVLHHTFKAERIVPDSSRLVNRQNTITVDCLFYEDQGFLMCYKNNEALSKVVNWIEEKTTRKSKNHQPSFIQTLKRPRLTYVTLMSGKTLGRHVDIEKKLQELIPGLQMVMKLEESDFILIFCPVVTQAGTDIVEALKMLNTQAGDKRAVLVVLHHTFNPELIVPDSSRLVNRQNTITVDCLFYEDQGLLKCHKNNEALSKVVNWLRPKGDENPEKNNILDNFV